MENSGKECTKIARSHHSSLGGQRYAAHAKEKEWSGHLRIWYTNADSVRGKLPELGTRLQVEEETPDIIVISESWPKNNRVCGIEAEYQLNGYNLHCTKLDYGRGICIYTKFTLNISHLEFRTAFQENICISMPLQGNDKLLICAIYRSPNSDETNNALLLELLDEVYQANASHKLILGDFNLPNIDWSNYTDRQEI